MKVLLAIVENKAVCETLRAALPESDLLIFESTVDGAGRRLVSIQVDAIILDDGPRLGGEAVGHLKAIAPNTPVLVLTSRSDLVTQASLTRAGADVILAKPFSCETLIGTLDDSTRPSHPALRAVEEKASGYAGGMALSRHQMALRWLSRVAAFREDPLRVSRSLVESAVDLFDAVRSAVLLEQEGSVRVVASDGIPDTITAGLRLSYAGGLMRWFDEHACVIDRETAGASPEALKEMQLLSARLAAPLLRNGRVFGSILLGEKASGLEYSCEERELLALVARTASVAMERAGAGTASQQQHQGLDRVLAHAHMGVVVVAPDKTVALLNPRAEALFEVKSESIAGRSVQKLGSVFADAALRALAAGEGVRQETIQDSATGAYLEINSASLGAEGIVITVTKAREERAATDDIAHSPFWEYLSTRVAQEIKNPMVAINTFAQLLPRKYDSEDFRDAFSRVVQKEIARINGVVETLFEFARDPQLTLKHCSVNETIENILASFDEELSACFIELETKWDPRAVDAEIDSQFFSQALHNVVQNSIEAMPAGGKLSISTHQREGETEICISDTGPGVREEEQSLIFLPFYSTKERGMGLGLTTANRIVQQHQGNLKLVANDEGGGSCFSIRLPSTGKEHADHTGD